VRCVARHGDPRSTDVELKSHFFLFCFLLMSEGLSKRINQLPNAAVSYINAGDKLSN
jgi:hypothetical protein